MPVPIIKSGKFHAGADFVCGENVVIDVAEEVVLGDRCTLGDNTYLGGRQVVIGDDFYGYSWEWRRLDVGRGRRDERGAVLRVGHRCTFHDNRIDLAKPVYVGNDVGLSPEVTIYTHHYWQSVLQGFPCRYAKVDIDEGVIVGYRSTILPGVRIEHHAVVGAGSVVANNLYTRCVYGGVPAREIGRVQEQTDKLKSDTLTDLLVEYNASLVYRRLPVGAEVLYPNVEYRGCVFDVRRMTVQGEEDEYTDDLRWFLFKRGIRFYTKRRFRKMARKV